MMPLFALPSNTHGKIQIPESWVDTKKADLSRRMPQTTCVFGEFVITQAIVYLITPTGQVRELDDTQAVFAE